MGIVIRQGLKSTIVIYAGVLLGAFNLLWLFPKYLDPEEIGLIRVLLEMGVLFALLSQFGISNIADKFFTFFKNDEKKHQGFLFILLFYSTIGFIIISIVYLITYPAWISFYEEKSPLLLNFLYYIIPLSLLIMYLAILEAYSRVHMRIVVPSAVREFFLRLAQTGIVVLYSHGLIGLNGMVILLMISYLIGIILILIYIKKLKKLYLSVIDFKHKKGLVKEMVNYGMYIFLGSASGLIASKVDIMMVSSYSGLDFAGIYSIAFFMGTIIEIPRRPISGISGPLLADHWKNRNMDGIKDLYQKSSLNQLIVGTLLFLLIWINIDYLFLLMPNSEIYIIGKYVVLFIGLARLIEMGTGVNGEIIVNSPFYRVNLFLSVISGLLIIGLNYFLIPLYNINGAALAILINFFLSNLLRCIIIWRECRIQPFTRRTIYTLAIGGFSYLLILLIPEFLLNSPLKIFLRLVLNSIIIGTVFLGLIYFYRISLDINRIFDALLLKKK